MAQVQDFSAADLRLVPTLLWDVVADSLHPAEREEVRRCVGSQLVEANEALYQEASALADILGEVSLSNERLLARQQLCSNAQRSMVEGEIRMLMERLRAAACISPLSGSSGGSTQRSRAPDDAIPKANAKERQIYEYVNATSPGGSRPSTASLTPGGTRPSTAALSFNGASRPGTASAGPGTRVGTPEVLTIHHGPPGVSVSSSSGFGGGGILAAAAAAPPPFARALSGASAGDAGFFRPGTASSGRLSSRPSTAASSAASAGFDARAVVASLRPQLNLSSIDQIKGELRGMLAQEKELLLQDVDYLQMLLEEQADVQVTAAAPPPSLQDLRDYSAKLAEVCEAEEQRAEHELRVSTMFAAAESSAGRAGRLRGMVSASRQSFTLPGREASGRLHSPEASTSGTDDDVPPPATARRSGVGLPLPAAGAAGAAGLGAALPPPSPRPLSARVAAAVAVFEGPRGPPSPDILKDRAPHSILTSSSSNIIKSAASPLTAGGLVTPRTVAAPRPLPHAPLSSESILSPSAALRSSIANGGMLAAAARPVTPAAVPSVPGAAAAYTPGRRKTTGNVVADLEAEWDSVKGGVAAILAKHNYTPRPASPARPPGAAAAPARASHG